MKPWKRDTVRWQAQARQGSGMDRTAASLIVRHIGASGTLLDAGAGLGFLSTALAEKGREVTAMEKSPAAYAYLCSHCHPLVHPVHGDVHSRRPPIPYRDVVCSVFGSLIEDLAIARTQASGNLVIACRDTDTHRFSFARGKTLDNAASRTEALLDSLGIPFEKEEAILPCGQYFKDRKDAKAFYDFYGSPIPVLKETDGPYPLLDDVSCAYAFFFIRVCDIPPVEQAVNLLVVGQPGVGKSTLIGKLVPEGAALCGYRTKKAGENVYIAPAGAPIETDEAHLVGICGRGGFPEAFETAGVDIMRAGKGNFRVMDEMGFMESGAPAFQAEVFKALADDIPTVCAVKMRSTPYLDKVRASSHSLSLVVTPENRDRWASELERAIRNTPEWPFAQAVGKLTAR